MAGRSFITSDAERISAAVQAVEGGPGLTASRIQGTGRYKTFQGLMLARATTEIGTGVSGGSVEVMVGSPPAPASPQILRQVLNATSRIINQGALGYIFPVNARLYFVRLNETEIRIGKLQTVLMPRLSADVEVYAGDAPSETTNGEIFSAWDWMLADGSSLPAGTEVTIARADTGGRMGLSDSWYIIAAKCTEPPISWQGNV